MKWVSKGITVLDSLGNIGLLIPCPRDNAIASIDKEKEYSIEVKEKRAKRSLNANAYLWVLCKRIAEELSKNGYTSKEEVYRQAVRQSKMFDYISVPTDKVDDFKRKWEHQGLGWQIERTEYKTKAEGTTVLIVYTGSSAYNTEEMSRLLDCVIDECHQLGIETKPQEEINALLEEWGK